jgi:hypothetical protein
MPGDLRAARSGERKKALERRASRKFGLQPLKQPEMPMDWRGRETPRVPRAFFKN